MSSADLSARLNALNLGSSKVKDSPVKNANQPTQTRGRTQSNRRRGERADSGSPATRVSSSEIKAASQSRASKADSVSPKRISPVRDKDTTLPPPIRRASFDYQPGPTTSSKKRRPRYRKIKATGVKPQDKVTAPIPLSSEKPSLANSRPRFAYVVEMRSRITEKEKILGVFTTIFKANETATELASQSGVSHQDIVDVVSSFNYAGLKPPTQSRAIRKIWPNGTSEIRSQTVGARFEWIKVLPKELPASAEDGRDRVRMQTVYLALDQCRVSLFVIGAFEAKDKAWEACQKYWTQLSYCTDIENEEQWVDERLMPNKRGVLAGNAHRWFVEVYDFDAQVE